MHNLFIKHIASEQLNVRIPDSEYKGKLISVIAQFSLIFSVINYYWLQIYLPELFCRRFCFLKFYWYVINNMRGIWGNLMIQTPQASGVGLQVSSLRNIVSCGY